MGLLVLAVNRRDLLIYFIATATAGASYGLLFSGALRLIHLADSSRHRGAVFSYLYLVGYLSMAALALVLGAAATAWGLRVAIELGATTIPVVSLMIFILSATTPPNTAKIERTK
jgi:hypothetical protein